MIVKEETVYTEIYCSLKNDINDTLNSNEKPIRFFFRQIFALWLNLIDLAKYRFQHCHIYIVL
jgi:hypothetical protein